MAESPPSPPRSRSWTTLWYYAVVVLTVGLLSGVPFAHAATRLRGTRRLWCVGSAAVYTVVMVVAFAITPTPQTTPPDNTGATIALSTMIVALAHLTFVRRWVHGTPTEPSPAPTVDPAVEAVLQARRRRDEARAIVERDPSMARELRIGRPDLSRTYDDGGLVDLNSAPAEVIAWACGVDRSVAEQLVTARTTAGVGFRRVDDVFAWTEIPVDLWDRIRDRAVCVV